MIFIFRYFKVLTLHFVNFTALYGNLNIWYAGIIAENACPGNKSRLLVFFDDGFAQYLPIKKLHKVHHKGKSKTGTLEFFFKILTMEIAWIVVGNNMEIQFSY